MKRNGKMAIKSIRIKKNRLFRRKRECVCSKYWDSYSWQCWIKFKRRLKNNCSLNEYSIYWNRELALCIEICLNNMHTRYSETIFVPDKLIIKWNKNVQENTDGFDRRNTTWAYGLIPWSIKKNIFTKV